eukprot:1162066-Pelagomonas_calceolata.AAC.9
MVLDGLLTALPRAARLVKPPHVVLVHGEKTEMMRLKGALEKAAAEKEIPRSVYTPAILQTVKVHQPSWPACKHNSAKLSTPANIDDALSTPAHICAAPQLSPLARQLAEKSANTTVPS